MMEFTFLVDGATAYGANAWTAPGRVATTAQDAVAAAAAERMRDGMAGCFELTTYL